MADRMQYCAACGEPIGVFYLARGEFESCGKKECEREVNDMRRGASEEAAARASEDDYERYR